MSLSPAAAPSCPCVLVTCCPTTVALCPHQRLQQIPVGTNNVQPPLCQGNSPKSCRSWEGKPPKSAGPGWEVAASPPHVPIRFQECHPDTSTQCHHGPAVPVTAQGPQALGGTCNGVPQQNISPHTSCLWGSCTPSTSQSPWGPRYPSMLPRWPASACRGSPSAPSPACPGSPGGRRAHRSLLWLSPRPLCSPRPRQRSARPPLRSSWLREESPAGQAEGAREGKKGPQGSWPALNSPAGKC